MDVDELLLRLREQGATLATAESLTGGRLAALVTGVPGASRVYIGGVVAYASEVKQQLLGVPADLVARHSVVSPECARAMAEGVRSALGTTWAVSTTGVAGPDQQEGKAVGTVFVGVAGPVGATVTALELVGGRHEIQERTCREAVSALGQALGAVSPEEEPGLG